jgi:Tfp pilus assembly protein PilO
MNSDKNVNKLFIGQMIFFNLIILILVIIEVKKFTDINKIYREVSTKQEELALTKEVNNIDEINRKYDLLLTEISKENSLANLLNFVEQKTTENNIQILNTKVIEASESNITYQIQVTGDIKNIANFIKNIEEDKNIKEVINSKVEFSNNTPYMIITIKVTKI